MSLYYEDEDDKQRRIRNKQQKKELEEFQRQIRLQKCFSELDMFGRGKVKTEIVNPNLTPSQQAKAMSIVYDA